MINILTRKLELFGKLGADDKALLDQTIKPTKSVPAGTHIISEGDNPTDVHLVLKGLAARSKITPEGGRQIFAFLLPGDFCDLNVFILKAMDHDIETISDCITVDIPRTVVLELCERPNIVRALWWATLVDEATLREWLVNLGQREATQRLAHLFCELHLRMASIGLVSDGHFKLPLTQAALGDAMGISSVHANRAMQALRAEDLVDFRSGEVTILDIQRLEAFSDFNPNYLHLTGGKREA